MLVPKESPFKENGGKVVLDLLLFQNEHTLLFY